MIEHGQISNLIASNREYFSLGENDRVFQLSSLSYDSSVEEIFMAWSVGASLVVGSDRVVRLGPDLPDWLSHYGITVFTPPPTLWTMGDHHVASRLMRCACSMLAVRRLRMLSRIGRQATFGEWLWSYRVQRDRCSR